MSKKQQALLLYVSTEDIIASVENERRRLAGLLQSEVVESLNLLLSQANIYEQTLSANPMARMAVSILTSLARQTLQQARDLGDHLFPAMLETLGLEPALENLSSQISRARGIRINLELERLPERLPRRIELALFRLTQEFLDALSTVNATQATVHLQRQAQQVDFELGCNGRGALDERLLQGTRQWLEQLGGQFQPEQERAGEFNLAVRFMLTPLVQLTPREMEVIQLVAEGLSNKEIGRSLSISPRTVNFHLDNLFSKLGVRSRTEAAVYALRQGYVRRKF
jgi:DNA-binding CsgD family transcriptional regulator